MPPHAMSDGEVASEYAGLIDGGVLPVVAKLKETSDAQFSVADFKPIRPLGNGDMGYVFLVQQRNNGTPYAMKVMKKEVLRLRKNEHRAVTEREILSSVNHPFLPVLHSHFGNEKHLFLVMNYCHGGDLNVLRQNQTEKRFSENACRFYVAEVLLALEYLHKRNIVYRDLKPENILIQSSGHIMLTDFDLSLDLSDRKWTPLPKTKKNSKDKRKAPTRVSNMKAFFACGSPMSIASSKPSKKPPDSRVTPEDIYAGRKAAKGSDGPAHSFVGTEEYVAPEIVVGQGHGLPVDWWTLGILLYELYYGKTPFKGANRKETFFRVLTKVVDFPGPSSPITDLMRQLLVKEPEDRLGTKGGAEEIKGHPFFDGVNWEELQYVSRAPVVPDPFSWEQIQEDLNAKAKAAGKEVPTTWSFFHIVDPSREAARGERQQQQHTEQTEQTEQTEKRKSSRISSQNIEGGDSAVSTSQDFSVPEDSDAQSSEEAFMLDRPSGFYPNDGENLFDDEESVGVEQRRSGDGFVTMSREKLSIIDTADIVSPSRASSASSVTHAATQLELCEDDFVIIPEEKLRMEDDRLMEDLPRTIPKEEVRLSSAVPLEGDHRLFDDCF